MSDTQNTISVARALTRIKTITARLERGVSNNVVEIAVGLDDKMKPRNPVYKDIESATTAVESNFQSVRDLIEERSKLKRLVNQSNANTKVVISEKEYTIAEAIDLKSMSQAQLKIISQWKSNVLTESAKVSLINDRLANAIADKIKSLADASPEAMEAIRTSEEKANTASLINPLNVGIALDKWEEEVQNFMIEVDVIINETNSVTSIQL